MRRATTALVGLMLLGSALGMSPAALPAVAQDAPAEIAAKGYNPDKEECAFLDQINNYRRKKNKPELRLSAPLGQAAENHSADMARHDYFSHKVKGDRRSWKQNIRHYGYKGDPISENIAAGTNAKSARVAMKMWKKSAPHNKTMLNGDFRAIGIGRAYDKGSKYGWYWTTTFGGAVEKEVSC